MVRYGRYGVVLAIFGAIAAPVAGAAVSVSVQDSELRIVGSADNDEVGVGFDAATGLFRVRATDIAVGAGCVGDIPAVVVNAVAYPAGATCTIPGGATVIRVDLGAGIDLLNSGLSFPGVGDDFTVPMIVNGGDDNDRLVTSSGNDVINGGAGNDTPDGSLGDDQINGGPGEDQINDHLGNDVIDGGGDPRDFIQAFLVADGADRWSNGIASYQRRKNALSITLDGTANDGELGEGDNLGPGILRVIGGEGDDTMVGGSGADILEGWLGSNRLDGRAGADILIGDRNRGFVDMPPPRLVSSIAIAPTTRANLLIGGPGADLLFGDTGPDKLTGGSGADSLAGGGGGDLLIGGRGADRLSGGDGADQFIARDGSVDLLTCGRGRDRVLSADRGRRPDRLALGGSPSRNRCEFGANGLRI